MVFSFIQLALAEGKRRPVQKIVDSFFYIQGGLMLATSVAFIDQAHGSGKRQRRSFVGFPAFSPFSLSLP